MAKEEKVEFEGEVVEALPNAMFRVQLDNGHEVLGHVAGKMRRFRIRHSVSESGTGLSPRGSQVRACRHRGGNFPEAKAPA